MPKHSRNISKWHGVGHHRKMEIKREERLSRESSYTALAYSWNSYIAFRDYRAGTLPLEKAQRRTYSSNGERERARRLISIQEENQ